MHIVPILSTLRRHRTAATLIVLQIAFTCAIVCNAIFLIRDRIVRMDTESGLVEDELVRIRVTGITRGKEKDSNTQADLAALKAIPGVKAVVSTNMVPFGNSSWNSSMSTKPDDPHAPINASTYLGTPELLETFGLTLIAGRDFTADEYVDFEAVQKDDNVKLGSIIITKGIAEKLFPNENALGKPVYIWGNDPQTVVGIIDHISRPNEINGPEGARYAVIFPINVSFGHYVIRTDPARKDEVLAAAGVALDKVDKARIVLDSQTFGELRHKYFRQDRAMAYLMGGVSIALLIITALGVVGLASFWVQQRTRQIGIRRALGATRSDILRYFQLENFILATVGIVVGMAMAYGINLVLMDKYEVGRLPAGFLPIGAALLWLLGQVAVLGPALRASMIPPAIATRTV
jgi:putative ABC transport system permease protein